MAAMRGLVCLEMSQNKGIDAFPGRPRAHLHGRELLEHFVGDDFEQLPPFVGLGAVHPRVDLSLGLSEAGGDGANGER